jgi:hypothetical protein
MVSVKVRDAEAIPMPTAGRLLLTRARVATVGVGRLSQAGGLFSGGTWTFAETVLIVHTFPFFDDASPVLTKTVTAALLQGGALLPACDGSKPGGKGAVSI